MIFSDEGSTQGDPAAMPMYALSTRPLIDSLQETLDEYTKQVWYADDSTAAGKLASLLKWWEKLCLIGPKFGYFPNPHKTVLILKGKEYQSMANTLFQSTGIEISVEGERHLGAVIGSVAHKERYVEAKVSEWVKDVKQLADYGQEEPQLAYSAYTKGLCHRWKFLQRTIPEIGHLFLPLEDAIRDSFIPAITGHQVSETQRKQISLPLRLGGLGIQIPTETADAEYHASCQITENLTQIIEQQENSFDNYDRSSHGSTITGALQILVFPFPAALAALSANLRAFRMPFGSFRMAFGSFRQRARAKLSAAYRVAIGWLSEIISDLSVY